MSTFLWFSVWAASMAALLGGYLLITRRHRRDVRETIRRASVQVPMNTAAWSGTRTFTCSHFSAGNVQSASCGICGPLPVAA